MNSKSRVTKERAELNCHIRDESKEIKDGAMGDGRQLSKEEDFRVNEDLQGVNGGRPEQQLQGWEEFLSVRSLKVLLVENDDGTRNILRALLQNCGYEVIEADNGIRAWEILEDLTTHVDLILSEVVMPSLSGMDLLTNIMDHKTRKNIPVIMMSSQDSMSTVIKCLSRGAVDFLLKPIRKNELKNLWRHVWRKCQRQSSGSGSASDIGTQKSTKSSGFEESDKNTGSNCEDNVALGNISLTDKDEGDNGSGTETSQVDPSRDDTFGNDGVPAFKTSEGEGQNEELGDVVMGKDSAIGLPRTSVLQLDEPKEEGLTNTTGTNKDRLPEMDSKNDDEQTDKGQPELNNEKPNRELRNQAVDLMGGIGNSTTFPQMQCIMFDVPNGVFKLPEIKAKAIHDSKEIPSLELSLMTQRDVQDARCSGHDQNVLRHSNNSAFSRYKFSTNSKQTPSGSIGSYYPLGNSSGGANAKSFQNCQSKSYGTPLYQRSNGCSNNNDTGSTTNKFFANEEISEDNAGPRSIDTSCVFQPDHNRIMSYNQPIKQGQADAAVHNTTLSQEWGMNQHLQVLQQHHHMHNMRLDQHQQMLNHDGLSLKNLAAAAPQCGSSNVQGAPMEPNVGSNSLHGCALERNNSINGQSGGSSAINSRGTYMESDKHIAGEGGTISATEGGSKTEIDQNRLAQREAALHKFRQKRKDRCFEKKVRYQSRKKLAEERPRVRGQFIRNVVNETKGNDTDS
ncbi:two-component response regulator-like PRR73 [Pyrus communis]|uniref:two-component response regulator-like PRR73 n=1 Tax=Pyrus communis TaxID=23211 RepID=UPI0035C150C4